MNKPYLCISCSYTPGVGRYLNTLVKSGVIYQVRPIVFMWEPEFEVPKEFTVYKQGMPYQGNKEARLPLLSMIPTLGLQEWYIWTDAQDIVFQAELPMGRFNTIRNEGDKVTSVIACPEYLKHNEADFWINKCQGDEFHFLLDKQIYNSGCFAMTGIQIMSYFAALMQLGRPGRYGNTGYNGDQLIFNKWLYTSVENIRTITSLFGTLYAGYTGKQWTGSNKIVDTSDQNIKLKDNKFTQLLYDKPISILHAPGSTKELLDAVYPISKENSVIETKKNFQKAINSRMRIERLGVEVEEIEERYKKSDLVVTDKITKDDTGVTSIKGVTIDHIPIIPDKNVQLSDEIPKQKEPQEEPQEEKLLKFTPEKVPDKSFTGSLKIGDTNVVIDVKEGDIQGELQEEQLKGRKEVRYAAICCVYNEENTIAFCLKSIYDHVDKIVITTSDYMWSGAKQALDQTVNIIKAFPDSQNKIYLIKDRWPRDDYARNTALDYLEQEGYGKHYALIVDGDELWPSKDLLKLKIAAASLPEKTVFRSSWYTHWKDIYHVIDPPENFLPIVMVKVDSVRFYWIRDVVQKERLAIIGRDKFAGEQGIGYRSELSYHVKGIMLNHLSWSRPDKEVQEKIEKSPHRKEFLPNWFENVWLKWNENHDLENLHPTHPPTYKKAVKIKDIPEVIAKYAIRYTMNKNKDVVKVDFIPKEKEDGKKDIKEITLDNIKDHGKVLRENVVNFFTGKFKYSHYLEIGSQRRDCFIKVKSSVKHDCEPNPLNSTPHFKGNSNDFFKAQKELNLDTVYNVIFIDGLHKCEQVLFDVKNSSSHLSEKGWIILHDCLPKEQAGQEREMTAQNKHRWNGDVWKAQAWLVRNFEQVWTLSDTDQGCGVIYGKLPDFEIPSKEELTDMFNWRQYIQERDTLLHCLKWVDFLKMDIQ